MTPVAYLEAGVIYCEELLADTSELVTPVTGKLIDDLPLPSPRAERPSAEELVASDRNSD